MRSEGCDRSFQTLRRETHLLGIVAKTDDQLLQMIDLIRLVSKELLETFYPLLQDYSIRRFGLGRLTRHRFATIESGLDSVLLQ